MKIIKYPAWYPCLLFLFNWLAGCATVPLETRYQSFNDREYSSRSVPAKIIKGKLSALLDSEYLLIGYLDVRRNIRKCFEDNTCEDISDEVPSRSDILQQAADRGGDLVFLLETRDITEKVSKSKCISMSYSATTVNGIVQLTPVCSSYQTTNGILEARISRALIWRKEPALATPEANAAAIEKALKTLDRVYAKNNHRQQKHTPVSDKPLTSDSRKRNKMTPELVNSIRTSAQKGDAVSQLRMGLIHEFALGGVKRSYKKARAWYLLSAKQNNPAAMVQIGLLYFNGTGVRLQRTKAFKWMMRAARLGHARAQSNVCVSYSAGLGVARNPVKARLWCEKAHAQNSLTATAVLGTMYLRGAGGPRLPVKGIRLVKKAAVAGHAFAQYVLGESYFLGNGVKVDKPQAINWLRKAVKQHNKFAQYMLGYLYEKGDGVRRNPRKALALYKLAAAQGHSKALQRIGGSNDEGNPVGILQ